MNEAQTVIPLWQQKNFCHQSKINGKSVHLRKMGGFFIFSCFFTHDNFFVYRNLITFAVRKDIVDKLSLDSFLVTCMTR